MSYENQTWILKRRPVGLLKSADLELREDKIAQIGDGECLIKVQYLAMDPATRGWMSETGGYVDPLPLDGPVMGVSIGTVIESRNAEIKDGTAVAGVGPWGKYNVVGPNEISSVQTGELGRLAPMDTSTGHPLPMYLHAMGTSGLTAYYGLVDIGQVKEGDRVLVSAAAGSVGSLACQIARLKGASRVVGIAGGDVKCKDVTERYRADAVIDYKNSKDISAAIGDAFPDGLDVYFDNVGGEILEAALNHLTHGARVPVCGMISQYNATDAGTGVRNLWNLLVHEARIEGFLLTSYFGTPECVAAANEISEWLKSGEITAVIDERDLFSDIVKAYNLLFSGGNRGRLIVRVPE